MLINVKLLLRNISIKLIIIVIQQIMKNTANLLIL
nr:MAG TPA: hypothetical protein [Crassvirales sp.]